VHADLEAGKSFETALRNTDKWAQHKLRANPQEANLWREAVKEWAKGFRTKLRENIKERP